MLTKLHSILVEKAPTVLSKPLQLMPFSLKQKIIEQLLQAQFKQSLDEGDLDFLTHRWLKIEICDLKLIWFVSHIDQKLVVSRMEIPDVSFSANTNDLVLIALRKQDPDTLFFQRRLIVEGDTELGLGVKNLMDSIDLDSMPRYVYLGLEYLASFIESSSSYQHS